MNPLKNSIETKKKINFQTIKVVDNSGEKPNNSKNYLKDNEYNNLNINMHENNFRTIKVVDENENDNNINTSEYDDINVNNIANGVDELREMFIEFNSKIEYIANKMDYIDTLVENANLVERDQLKVGEIILTNEKNKIKQQYTNRETNEGRLSISQCEYDVVNDKSN